MTEHGRLALGEQQACTSRMHGVERALVRIQHEDLAHDEPPLARVKVASTMCRELVVPATFGAGPTPA